MTGACAKLYPTCRRVCRMKHEWTLLLSLASLWACTPTVQVAAPKEPIEINMNVKIEHNIRVQVDKELEGMFDEDSELF